MTNTMFRILNAICFAMFLLSIALQYNDPDPLPWMGLYAIPAVITWMGIFRQYTVFSAVFALLYTVAFFWWVPTATITNPSHLFTDLQMHEKGVEEAREAFGLLICAAWMAVLAVAWWSTRKSHSEDQNPVPATNPNS